MRKRISLLVAALMVALSMSLSGVALGDPDCAPPKKPPCHDPGGPP